ncbi:MAG: hypothetical protein L6R40_002539 [Gallowayella cf. fulva]|nr:MAG: hypothetical protein L6R40_002539 [Xanthomendoza cf. fulva]
MPTPPLTYTSHLLIPYTSPTLPLRTLDLHIPTTPPSTPSYTIIYIHGGAFRDPLITSTSLLPSLPFLFPASTSNHNRNPNPNATSSNSTPNKEKSHKHHIASIASLNYRLAPYPTHPTHPSSADDESRNARWPDQVADVRAAMKWLVDNDARDGYEGLRAGSGIILVGHSVGATIAFAVALGLHEGREEKFKGPRERIKSVVGVEGVYDFTALRDAHAGFRDVYEEFTKGVFGDERHGGWEEGNIVRMVREGGEMDRVEVVVLGQSREDELVEWGQGGASGGGGKGGHGRGVEGRS